MSDMRVALSTVARLPILYSSWGHALDLRHREHVEIPEDE